MDNPILWAGAVSGALVGVGVLVRSVLRFGRKVDNFLSDWNGEPARPGVPERPGVMKRLETVEFDVAHVKHQVTPNGGNTNTLGDRVVRIEQAAAEPPAQQ